MKNLFRISGVILLIFIIHSCKKDMPTPPVLTTTSVTDISYTTATSGGNATSEGGAPIISRGVCWNTLADPTVDNSKTTESSGLGTFTTILTQLTPNTLYYVRAYATNAAGTGYGNQVTFTTLQVAVPVLTTTAINSIAQTTAVSGGNVTSDNGGSVTVRGVCWGTTTNPSISLSTKTTDGTGTGVFTSSIIGLTVGTTYYVRSYATNNAGTSYGNEVSFTTQPATVPTLTTAAVSSITGTTATSGGNITSDGGASITARGACWSTTPNPDITGSITSNSTGTGSFVSNITGLTPGSTYYVRAYATNNAGTAYGNQLTFSASAVLPTLTTTVASSITITTATSGGNISSEGGANVTVRGVCWSTSTNPTTADNTTSNSSGSGTFVSSLTGLTSNTTYFVKAYATNSVGTAYGNQVSFTTAILLPALTTDNARAITTTSATSGGNIASQGGAPVTARGVCWNNATNPTIDNSKTADGSGTGTFISSITGLTHGTTYYVRAYATNSGGTSYGNEVTFTAAIVIPTVSTLAVGNITTTTASSGGNITDDGGATVTARGICWSTSPSPTTSNDKTSNGTGTGAFISNLTGLSPATIYYIRAYATNNAGTSYGNVIIVNIYTGTVTDIDANIYNTVTIGTQVWMTENLKSTKFNDATSIPLITDGPAWDALSTPGYCWYNNDAAAYKATYGALYNAYTATTGKLCPTGWHVPSVDEWTTLVTYLGGETVAGSKLKESGTTHWIAPNAGATNETGFSALPGGLRTGYAGSSWIGNMGNWWTSTGVTYAWALRLGDDGSVGKTYYGKTLGYSVRCLKD